VLVNPTPVINPVDVIAPEPIVVTPERAPAFNVAVPSVIVVPSKTILSTVNFSILELPVDVIAPDAIV